VRRLFFDLISELAGEGVTTLITTHVMEEAEYCNRLLLIYQSRKVTEGTPAELRALVPGRLFEVKLPDALEAQKALLGLPEILNASLFGSSLHVVLSDAVVSPETRLREILGQRGYTPQSLRPVRRSMEHAFLYLTGDAVSEGAR
jgi:ABC-2 type transport system ATP-binding protein